MAIVDTELAILDGTSTYDPLRWGKYEGAPVRRLFLESDATSVVTSKYRI
jgi:hypothetical protein